MNTNLFFQYCPKLIVFSADASSVLLAKRKGEQDYDGVYSFIGGKIETTDENIIEGIRREKTEEIGSGAKILVAQMPVYNAFFRKKDGSAMILPHHICKYVGGEIKINEEYSEYKWVSIEDLESFEPKIETITPAVNWALRFLPQLYSDDFVEI